MMGCSKLALCQISDVNTAEVKEGCYKTLVGDQRKSAQVHYIIMIHIVKYEKQLQTNLMYSHVNFFKISWLSDKKKISMPLVHFYTSDNELCFWQKIFTWTLHLTQMLFETCIWLIRIICWNPSLFSMIALWLVFKMMLIEYIVVPMFTVLFIGQPLCYCNGAHSWIYCVSAKGNPLSSHCIIT